MPFILVWRVQQYGVFGLGHRSVQAGFVKGFASLHTAVRQTHVEQARGVLRVTYLQRMLQDQHLGLVRDRRDPVADAGALGPLALGADGALQGQRVAPNAASICCSMGAAFR